MFEAFGSREREHPRLHGEAKYHLRSIDAEPLRDGDHLGMLENIRVCSQQGETLIHDSLAEANRTDIAVPAAIGKAAVLYSHGFDLRLVDQGRELQGIHVADADHA